MFDRNSLEQWLSYVEGINIKTIDMGLERTELVRQKLELKPACPVITVAGTNGKGSVCAYLTAIYQAAGFKVGTLTSPHLLKFNERISINGKPVEDELIVRAFTAIEEARGDTTLTYFEFNALAAVWVFADQQVDVMVLETGLGGRLDAVNVFDADCAVITNVDLDHIEYLGDTIEKVGFEKAGIFRSGKPAICGQVPPPQSVTQHAKDIGTNLLVLNTDFTATQQNEQWDFSCGQTHYTNLPLPALRGGYQVQNAACALAAITCLNNQLVVSEQAIAQGLSAASNPGRFQVIAHKPTVILDVGHNPHAARALAASLTQLPAVKKQVAVFSMLSDKDIDSVLSICVPLFDCWYISGLNLPRGMTTEQITHKLKTYGIKNIRSFTTVATAYQCALSEVQEDDRIIVFGSFHTVAEILDSL